jgi:hypothetical protein
MLGAAEAHETSRVRSELNLEGVGSSRFGALADGVSPVPEDQLRPLEGIDSQHLGEWQHATLANAKRRFPFARRRIVVLVHLKPIAWRSLASRQSCIRPLQPAGNCLLIRDQIGRDAVLDCLTCAIPRSPARSDRPIQRNAEIGAVLALGRRTSWSIRNVSHMSPTSARQSELKEIASRPDRARSWARRLRGSGADFRQARGGDDVN